MNFQIRNLFFLAIISSCSFVEKSFYSSNKLNIDEDILYSPFAMQTIQIGKSDEELLLLNEVNKNIYKWSKENLRITSSNGKIVKSFGFHNDFELNYYQGIESLDDHSAIIRFKNPESDYMDILFSYRIVDTGSMIKIIDKSIFTFTLIEERFEVPKINWKGSNFYWIDSEGYVWKSEQYISPFEKKITINTLKKYSD